MENWQILESYKNKKYFMKIFLASFQLGRLFTSRLMNYFFKYLFMPGKKGVVYVHLV